MYTKILIRYGELTLKGKNRQNFIDILARNVSNTLGEKPQSKYDRMFVSYSQDNLKKLGNVFGISSFSPVIEVKNNIDEIFNAAKQLVSNDTQTFKVSARRSNKSFELSSSQINSKLGGFILSGFPSIKVDVHNPQKNINVEVRENQHLYSLKQLKA